jgi:hypothetical protein
LESFILLGENEIPCDKAFPVLQRSLNDKKSIFYIKCREILTIPGNEIFAKHLLAQGIKSCILAPVIKEDKLLGIMELVSSKPKAIVLMPTI